ncbi:MAG: hypothetical protein PHI86_07055 [Candidatus Omnitrophica bacterium]|nr:hypothetical protein [Candidatus Omnitrophota bacterium]
MSKIALLERISNLTTWLINSGKNGKINSMRKTLFGFLAMLAVFYPLSIPKAAKAEDICNLSEKYKTYTEAVKANDYSEEGLNKELLARKDLLSDSIDCAKLDVDSLKESLSKSPENVSGNLRNDLLTSLEEASSYYDQKKLMLDNLGIQGLKDIARSIHTWREDKFSVLAKRIKNFLVWEENQDIFTKTEERLKQITNLISSLKMIEDSNLQNILNKASGNLLNAKDENNKAKSSLERNLNSDEVLSPMKKSLEYLSNTYGNFLEISDYISRIIPRNKK